MKEIVWIDYRKEPGLNKRQNRKPKANSFGLAFFIGPAEETLEKAYHNVSI